VRDRWQSAGVVHLVHSCVTPSEFAQTQALADRFAEISFAVGLHPLDTQEWTPNTAMEIRELAQSDRRVVAIGETGLDFYKAEDRDVQIQVFREQLHIAHDLHLPVIIHCRDAGSALREVCQEFWEKYGRVNGVMHCWAGTPEETRWFLDLGFYISFSGVVTFKNAAQIQDSARIVPDDRLLIETDCPFLAPVPRRGKRNEPAYVRHVAEYLSQLRGVPLEQIARTTTDNAKRLFQLVVRE
jgi:TatD DNase family protein